MTRKMVLDESMWLQNFGCPMIGSFELSLKNGWPLKILNGFLWCFHGTRVYGDKLLLGWTSALNQLEMRNGCYFSHMFDMIWYTLIQCNIIWYDIKSKLYDMRYDMRYMIRYDLIYYEMIRYMIWYDLIGYDIIYVYLSFVSCIKITLVWWRNGG